MSRALEYIEKTNMTPPDGIRLNTADREKIRKPFLENLDRLHAGTLTARDILHCVAVSEFSEWNDFFIYVLNTLKGADKEFEYAADRMEKHRRDIEAFLTSMQEDGEEENLSPKKIMKTSRIRRHRFLIVDDAEEVAYLLKSILETEGEVDVAENGQEGLRKIGARHYNVILADVKMPVMNGTEMYQKAAEKEPDIRRRFLFLTGHLSHDLVSFFKENRLQYLQKPAGVNEIRHAVRSILQERPPAPPTG